MAENSNFNPPVKNAKALIAWAEQRKTEARSNSQREAYLNLAFMLGHQWVTWNESNRRLDRPRTRRGDPNAPIRLQINKMGAIIERVIARLTKSAPVPECRPVSDDEQDIGAAKMGTRTLQHELNRMHWDALLPRLYFWVLPLGWSFIHLYWNPEDGQRIDTPGLEAEDGEPVYEGQTNMEVVPALEMSFDPNAKTWDQVRWCVRTTNMTEAAIYEQYGVENVDGDTALTKDITGDIANLMDGTVGDSSSTARKSTANKFAVHQIWFKPGSRMYPAGFVLTWTGGTVLEHMTEFPYEHGQLPFIPFSLLPGLGVPDGRTWVSDLRGMQLDYNDARSREATIRRTLVPKIMAARGQIDPLRLSSRVEVVEYNPTGPEPKWNIPDGRWMAQFEAAMQRADVEMGDRAGQAEVSQGKAPAGAPAAAILALQEADETKLAVSAKEMADSIERLGWQVLMLARQFWEEERLVRAWSEGGKMEVMRFTGADIANQLDVHISTESMLPKSKSAKAQLALDLFDRGVIRDPSALIRLLEVPGVGFLQEEFDAWTRQAEREYDNLVQGMDVRPEDWHDHAAHIHKHNLDRTTREFEQLALADPAFKQRYEEHVMEHYGWLQFQTTGQLPAGLAGGGMQPGPAGGGGEPVEGGAGNQIHYGDPLTGAPPDPLMVAAGQSPSALDLNPPNALQGAGRVQGVTADEQAAMQGS